MRRLGLVAHIEAPFGFCRFVHTTVALAILGPEMNDTSDEAVTDEPSGKPNDTCLDGDTRSASDVPNRLGEAEHAERGFFRRIHKD